MPRMQGRKTWNLLKINNFVFHILIGVPDNSVFEKNREVCIILAQK